MSEAMSEEEQEEVASANAAYSFRRLAGSGRGWPKGVDPTRREEWLSPSEFGAVFGMTFEEFKVLPRWRKAIMKREVLLF
ncbi:unnamed protein product [Laminaria digitata]